MKLIDADALIAEITPPEDAPNDGAKLILSVFIEAVKSFPAVDAVPWEFLERYSDWFCAVVSMPEFVREAKAFYKSTCDAMDGGVIGQCSEDVSDA